MRERYVLVLDIGTSSLKAAIIDEKLLIVAFEKVDYSVEVPHELWVQINPEKIWEAFLTCARSLKKYLKEVVACICCNFCPSPIPMNKIGDPLYPAIVHLDRRSYNQSKEILNIIGKNAFLQETGNLPFSGGISLTSILWLKENEPEVFNKTYMFGHMNTFLIHRLTDEWVIDTTNASFTGLYSTIKRSGWCKSFADEFGISIGKLPQVEESNKVIGKVSKKAARLTGLLAGIPVVMGANDTSCAAVGAGANKDGDILNISGSNEILTITVKKPIRSEKYYIRTHPLSGLWLILVITVGGFALEWFHRVFCREMTLEEFYKYLDEVLKRDTLQSSVEFEPHLAGDRHSLEPKYGALKGLTLKVGRENCLKAIVDGMIRPMAETIDRCKNFVNINPQIYFTGGGSNRALAEYKKRTLFKDYDFTIRGNCSIIGAAKLAWQALKKTYKIKDIPL